MLSTMTETLNTLIRHKESLNTLKTCKFSDSIRGAARLGRYLVRKKVVDLFIRSVWFVLIGGESATEIILFCHHGVGGHILHWYSNNKTRQAPRMEMVSGKIVPDPICFR